MYVPPSSSSSSTRRREDLARLESAASSSQPHSAPVPHPPSTRATTSGTGTSSAGDVPPSSMAPETLVTVVHFRGGVLECPLCKQVELDIVAFKSHVFDCRVQRGLDPLLPLTVIRPKDAAAPTTQPVGRPLPMTPRAPGTSSTRRAARASKGGATPSTASAQIRRTASSSGSQRRRPTWSVSSSSWGDGGHADDLDSILRPITSGVERIELFAGRPAALASVPAPEDKPKPPLKFTDSKVSEDLRYFLGLKPEDAEVLSLQGVSIGVRDAKLIHAALGDWQLVVPAIDFTGTSAITREAEHLVVRGVMRNKHIKSLRTQDCSFAAKLQSPAVRDHLVVNHRRREEKDRAANFDSWVQQYQAVETEAKARFSEIMDGERSERSAMSASERDARTAVCEAFEQEARTLFVRLRRREHRRRIQDRRDELADEENLSRQAGERLYLRGLLSILSRRESAERGMVLALRERERTAVKAQERNDIFEAKGRERARLEADRLARVTACRDEDAERERIVSQCLHALDVLTVQFRRRTDFLLWEQRKRDEVASLVKFEASVRDALIKERTNYIVSHRDKMAVVIKGVLAKYAAQREEVEVNEAAVRSHYTANFEELLQYEMAVFNLKMRMLRLKSKAAQRMETRRALLDTPPSLSVVLDDSSARPIYTMRGPGQPNRLPVTVAPNARLVVSMGAEWATSLQEVEAKCKALLAEEKATMTELLLLLGRQAPSAVRAREFVLGIPPDDLPRSSSGGDKTPAASSAHSVDTRSVAESAAASRTRTPSNGNAPASTDDGARDDFDDDEEVPEQHDCDDEGRAAVDDDASGRDTPWLRSEPFPEGFSKSTRTRSSSTQLVAPAFIAARDEALKLRCAWHDTAAVSAITAAKEAVVDGVATFWCSAARSDTEPEMQEELSTALCTSLQCELDGVPYADMLAQSESHHSIPELAQGATPDAATPAADTRSPQPGPALQGSADAPLTLSSETPQQQQQPPLLLSTGTVAQVSNTSFSSQRSPSVAGSLYDDSSEAASSRDAGSDGRGAASDSEVEDYCEDVPPPAASKMLTVRLAIREDSDGSSPVEVERDASQAAVSHFVKRRFLGKNVVGNVPGSVSYRCVAASALPTERLVKYRITAVFTRRSEYCVSTPVPDQLGYVPLLPGLEGESDEHELAVDVEGEVLIGLAPSPWCFPQDAPLSVDRVFVEGQKEEMTLIPSIPGVAEPHGFARDANSWRVLPPSANGPGYAGSLIRIEVFGQVTSDDRISIKDDINVKLKTMDLTTYNVRTITVHNQLVCTVVEGTLQSTRQVRQTNGPSERPFVVLRVVGPDDKPAVKRVDGDAIRAIVNRLHFHNTSVEGICAGMRRVRITIETPGNNDVVLYSDFEVQERDAPTEIRPAHTAFVLRQPLSLVPKDAVKDAVATPLLAVAHEAIVYDEDTDRFGGGSVTFTLSAGLAGDGLAVVASCHLLNPVYEAVNAPQPLAIDEAKNVIFEGRVVATLVSGNIITRPGDERDFEPCEQIKFGLALDDECSISAVECIIRHIVFYTTASNGGPRFHQTNSAVRDVTMEIEIGDGEQVSHDAHVVQIKPAGSVLQMSEKASAIEVKEGAPVVRLGPLDPGTDRLVQANTFGGGYVLLSVASGFEEGDTLGLREDIDFKLVTPATGPLLAVGRARRLTADATRKAEEHFKHRTQRLFSRAGWVDDLGARVLDKTLQAQELVLPGVKEPVGLLTWSPDGQHLLLQFYLEHKGSTVATKKVVGGVLRNLTYQHQVQDAQVETKILRVMCSDAPTHTPSQAEVLVNVTLVDDVTQILCAKPRRRFRGGMAPFPLFPHGQSILEDDDTDYFDGGHLLVNVSGSGMKHELVLVQPQRQFVASDAPPPEAQLTAPIFDDIFFTETEVRRYLPDEASSDGGDTGSDGGPKHVASDGAAPTLMVEGVDGDSGAPVVTPEARPSRAVASIVRGGKEGQSIEMRLVFPALPSDWKDDDGIVSLELASYLLNCVCLQGDQEGRTKDATRTVTARIRDPENPVDGKTKYTLDVSPSFITAAISSAAAAEGRTLADPYNHTLPALMPGARLSLSKLIAPGPLWEKPPAQGVVDVFVELDGDDEGTAAPGLSVSYDCTGSASYMLAEPNADALTATEKAAVEAGHELVGRLMKDKDTLGTVSRLPKYPTSGEAGDTKNDTDEVAAAKSGGNDGGSDDGSSGSKEEDDAPWYLRRGVRPRAGLRISWSYPAKGKVPKTLFTALMQYCCVSLADGTDASAQGGRILFVAAADEPRQDSFSRVELSVSSVGDAPESDDATS